ncbi:MAG: sigma-54-dependent Fis family transcriptional regulator [Desulfobacula sp.]|jgi:DNA-binding NtrC family response regulator|uniref:sigma-54-dependent transcriptional regulator n=1 Tax=Desulfobacula sp. TaxID=2593537 RepID=UPI001DE0D1BF|nr:sigma-54-dependent Fis family transcriptional regulator [Desulfobacula sp.]MBT3484945.1 sigma-54-dependent Fis family transcriptional regulator [Desulfobacula sp.]MBT3803219.1 sigma-54-dependent Fis family transcriptional regulator [Desulfobacula sp.]MBT4024602.1 sigma-54-dependent Fis family transcriptional regulator [Desulfobacula sp.]MBT4197574.1 sigma-54-dependent Fis family transcriptional regulator [Desulfobacula sp.]
MERTRILVVDDELIIRESLTGWLQRDGYHVENVSSGEKAIDILKTKSFDLLLLDIQMGGISGMDVLKHVKENYPDIDVIMITAFGSIPSAVKAMKYHAFDYLLKPFDPEELEVLIQKLVHHRAKIKENLFLKEEYEHRNRFESMIGQSRPMQEIFNLIEDIRDTDTTVLITGETGTGKGLAAKAIHSNSMVSNGPFVSVNCGAIPKHIMESELFGHQKGAFTDAKETRKGRLELAAGGTLFLDEIGEISMRMQIDLLQVLEDKIFYKVGGTQPITADFRVIAATNAHLEQAIKNRTFREDLYYRLNVITFTMPTLRARKEDIPLLAEHFLLKTTQEINRGVERISRDAMDELMLYEWPGNVRELSNAIERAVVVCKTRTITPFDLPIVKKLENELKNKYFSLNDVEKHHISKILNENNWNISKSAAILGIDRSTLYNKIKLYELNDHRGE